MIKKSLTIINVVSAVVFLLCFIWVKNMEASFSITDEYFPVIDGVLLGCPIINLLTILFVGFPDNHFRKNVIFVVIYILSIVLVNIVFEQFLLFLPEMTFTLTDLNKFYVLTWIEQSPLTLQAWVFTYHILQMNVLLITMIANKIRMNYSIKQFIIDNKILLICALCTLILNNILISNKISNILENGVSNLSYLCRDNIIIIFLLLVNIYYASYSKVMKIIANIIMVITMVVFIYSLIIVILDNDSSFYLVNLFICLYIIGISLFIWGLSWIIYRFKWFMNKRQ